MPNSKIEEAGSELAQRRQQVKKLDESITERHFGLSRSRAIVISLPPASKRRIPANPKHHRCSFRKLAIQRLE
jgi:hypothetical protein